MSKSRRGYQRLVVGASVREAELDLPEQLLERAAALVRRHQWDEDWGEAAPLIIFYHGLAGLELEQTAVALNRGDAAAAVDQTEPLDAHRLWLDGQCAILRFHLFELMRNNQVMTIRETALRIDNEGLRQRLERCRRERGELERQLNGQIGLLTAESPVEPPGQTEQPGPSSRSIVERIRTWVAARGGSDS